MNRLPDTEWITAVDPGSCLAMASNMGSRGKDAVCILEEKRHEDGMDDETRSARRREDRRQDSKTADRDGKGEEGEDEAKVRNPCGRVGRIVMGKTRRNNRRRRMVFI